MKSEEGEKKQTDKQRSSMISLRGIFFKIVEKSWQFIRMLYIQAKY